MTEKYQGKDEYPSTVVPKIQNHIGPVMQLGLANTSEEASIELEFKKRGLPFMNPRQVESIKLDDSKEFRPLCLEGWRCNHVLIHVDSESKLALADTPEEEKEREIAEKAGARFMNWRQAFIENHIYKERGYYGGNKRFWNQDPNGEEWIWNTWGKEWAANKYRSRYDATLNFAGACPFWNPDIYVPQIERPIMKQYNGNGDWMHDNRCYPESCREYLMRPYRFSREDRKVLEEKMRRKREVWARYEDAYTCEVHRRYRIWLNGGNWDLDVPYGVPSSGNDST